MKEGINDKQTGLQEDCGQYEESGRPFAEEASVNTASNNKRIAKNTLLLYFRMGVTLVVSLYTCRVVLDVLGFEDYGTYNVVGGVVLMFTSISGVLSSAISRFLSFEIGAGNQDRLRKVFSTSLQIQWGMVLAMIVLMEVVGVWFLNAKLNIPLHRMEAANWVLQCSIFTFALNLLGLPYLAAIMSHERMNAYAYISILEVLLKLVAVFVLSAAACDKLKVWAVMLMLISLVVFLLYRGYGRRNFLECRGRRVFDRALLKEITGFSGWNFIGASSAVLRDQGVNILLNLFYGTAVNAARAASMQVSVAISGFSSNIMAALNPQITKAYASGNREYMMTLIRQGSRFSFYLLLFFSLPVLIETPMVLDLFLKDVPEHTVLFVRLILISVMMESISAPLITAMLATGNIRNYQIVVGGLQLLNFPLSYVLLYWGFFPEVTVVVSIVCSVFSFLARLFMLRGMIGLQSGAFFTKVFLRVWKVALLSAVLPYLLYVWMDGGIGRLLLVCLASVFSTVGMIYYVGCDLSDRMYLKDKLEGLKKKWRK